MADDGLTPRAPSRLTGSEPIAEGVATVSDFWKWAFSDLRMNVDRGVFAEWLVGLALGCVDGVRAAWDDFDLATSDGIRVEVKSAAYLQAWPQTHRSAITFSRLSGHAADTGGSAAFGPRTYRADVFVFAVLMTKDHETLDPLDVDQWRFWVVRCDAVAATTYRSLSLSTVERLAGGPVQFSELGGAVRAAYGD